MFDTAMLGPSALHGADDATVVAAIADWARAEAAASARRLAAIGELASRRTADDDRAHWSCDDWDAAAAEVSAALGLSHGRASGQMRLAMALRQRFPQIAALFLDGELSYRVVSAVSWRTDLVQDCEALRKIDTELAARATAWGPLSDHKLEQAIDLLIDQYDPGALRRTRVSARSREIQIGNRADNSGIATIWGQLYASDGALLNRRLMQLAHGVCDDDPRTIAQRRADALGALAAGSDRLACTCGTPDCPATGEGDKRAGSVVIHVLAQPASAGAEPDPHISDQPADRTITPDTPLIEALTPDPEPRPPYDPAAKPPAAIIVGGGTAPPSLLAELIRAGATIRPLAPPGGSTEPGYRPSAALERFVRLRDLTCRFPGCDQAADGCDVDHTVPWPTGPTHPSNLACLCRKHHLLKTFWVGEGGWAVRQIADATLVWTTPTGVTYTTRPGNRLHFPTADTTSAPLPSIPKTAAAPADANRDVMMPTRRRTRAAARAYRIRCERALNEAHVAERAQPPPF